MRLLRLLPVLAMASTPVMSTTFWTLCQKYTIALFGEDTPANEYALLVRLVNTVVIGNYTQPNVGIAVPGILAPGMYGGHNVSLLQYFDGSLKSTNNENGKGGQVQNFLDDGGAAPLMQNMPSYHNGTAQ